MRYLKEAKDLSHYQIFDDKLRTIYQKDELVQAWHGTSMFWVLWFCMYGVDTTVEPPAKTLGRGTMETGFGKIDTKGLFVSASEMSGFRTLIQFEVKPSELGISLEMEQRGYKPDQVLNSLVAGDCIIVKDLPAKRIIQVKHNNEVFTRKEFIAKFPDPEQYLENEYRQNMLSGTSLRSKYEKEIIYKEYKKELASGDMTIEEAIESINDAIQHNDLEFWGITEEDAQEILNWLKGKVMTEKRIIFFESDLTAKEYLIQEIQLEEGIKRIPTFNFRIKYKYDDFYSELYEKTYTNYCLAMEKRRPDSCLDSIHFYNYIYDDTTFAFQYRKSLVFGQYYENLFIPTHFAPNGLKEGIDIIKLMKDYSNVAFVVTEDLSAMLSKIGFKVLPIKVIKNFRGVDVQKSIVVSNLFYSSIQVMWRGIKSKIIDPIKTNINKLNKQNPSNTILQKKVRSSELDKKLKAKEFI